jgi:hypothetical protein
MAEETGFLPPTVMVLVAFVSPTRTALSIGSRRVEDLGENPAFFRLTPAARKSMQPAAPLLGESLPMVSAGSSSPALLATAVRVRP